MTLPRSSGDRRIPQLIPHRLLHSTQLHHPAVLEEATRRSANIRLRLADRITAFARFDELRLNPRSPVRRVDGRAGKESLADPDPGGFT